MGEGSPGTEEWSRGGRQAGAQRVVMVGGGGSRVRGREPALGAGREARDHTHCLLGLRTLELGSPAAGSRGPALRRHSAPEAPPPSRNPPAQSDHESSLALRP